MKEPVEILAECFNPKSYGLIKGDYYKISHKQYLILRHKLEDGLLVNSEVEDNNGRK